MNGTFRHLFNLAHGGQILVHLPSVIGAQSAVQILSFTENFINHTTAAGECVAFSRRGGSEHATKNFSGIIQCRNWPPRPVKGQGRGTVRAVYSAKRRQHHGLKARVLPEGLGHILVNRDGLLVVCLENISAGQKIIRTLVGRGGPHGWMRQPGQKRNFIPHRHDALVHGRRDIVFASADRKPPVLQSVGCIIRGHRNAVGKEAAEEAFPQCRLVGAPTHAF